MRTRASLTLINLAVTLSALSGCAEPEPFRMTEPDVGCKTKATVVAALSKKLAWFKTPKGDDYYLPFAGPYEAVDMGFDRSWGDANTDPNCVYLDDRMVLLIEKRDGDLVCVKQAKRGPRSDCYWVSLRPPSRRAGAKPAEPKTMDGLTIQAIVMADKPKPMAFTDVREKFIRVEGQILQLICSNDGLAEVIVALDGKYYAMGGLVKSEVNKGTFWFIAGGTKITPVSTDGDGEERLWLRRRWETIRDTAKAMCPAAWDAGPRDLVDHMRRGAENYRRKAERLRLDQLAH